MENRIISWDGKSFLRSSLLEDLRQNGLEVRSSKEEPTGLRVVATLAHKPPHASETAWVWVPHEKPAFECSRAAIQGGARDVLPLTTPNFGRELAKRVMELWPVEEQLPVTPGFVARSPTTQKVLRRLLGAAKTQQPVFLTGETGVGKEVAAQWLHRFSKRAYRPFVAMNCAAIPSELMEGELFGYVKGAFSGATQNYDGLLSAAEGGSVFLDEIQEIPSALQAKWLRVLEDKVVSRLGENAWRKVDFRLVVATNESVQKLLDERKFRTDLFERISTLQIEIPPLRERSEDIPELVSMWIERFYQEEPQSTLGRVMEVAPTTMELLQHYAWPGNIRELRNVIFSALVQKQGGRCLMPGDLPLRLRTVSTTAATWWSPEKLELAIAKGTFDWVSSQEAVLKAAVGFALRKSEGNVSRAARLLGRIGRGKAQDSGNTLRQMMRRWK